MDTLRNYTFLPWTRRGISAEIPTVDSLGGATTTLNTERAGVAISFKVNGEPVAKTVEVLGPGDVIGINPRVVVKTEPRRAVTDFESNYLSYIEFYEEDFPWRFTPAKAADDLAQSRLRPWILLVLLKEEEFTEQNGMPLPSFTIKEVLDPESFFPDVEQSWAWAHVHVSQNIMGNTLQATTEAQVRGVEQTLEQQLGVNADIASSRLLCPRKLDRNAAYHAFVIPAFEAGRLAGLGLNVPAGTSGQVASWGAGQRAYPIYYRWFFRTGASGDFELLVDLLEPRNVDKRVGIRAMQMHDPGYEVNGMSGTLAVMGLEGALKSPQMESSPVQWPPAGTDFDTPPPGSAGRFLKELEQKVNLQAILQQEESADNPHPDPIVSPPLYGRWHALVERLDVKEGVGWVHELNRDPRYRAPAGAGAQVIQREQEKFMQQAWAQLGDLLHANQKIRQLQLAVMASFVGFQKNVLPQAADQLLTFAHPVLSRVMGSSTTLATQVKQSRLPRAAVDPAFRKIARPRGPIMRKVIPEGGEPPHAVLARLNSGALTAAPPAPEPTGQISLDAIARSTPSSLPDWLRTFLRSGLALAAVAVFVLLVVIATFVVSGPLLGFIAIAVAAGFALVIQRLRQQVDAPETIQESSFKPAAVDEIPPRPNFVLTEYEAPMTAATGAAGADSAEAKAFRVALKDAFNVYQSPPVPIPPAPPMNLDNAVAKLKHALNPTVAIVRRAEFILKIPPSIKNAYLRPRKTFVPVMAHPVFTEPMYRALRDVSAEFLAPNLDLVPNNTISLMETNQRFIEAYMVGLNDEMGRELLWRQFPTDQRGSYFRQFWDVSDTVNRDPSKSASQVEEELRDIDKLHEWGAGSVLGDHGRPLPTGAEPGDARLVLVIRGELLKKYPTAVIYAQQAKWAKDEFNRDIRVLDESNPTEFIKPPVFKAEVEPDIRFLGFDLTKSVAKGSPDPQAADAGWFFVIQERPGEPRFGLDDLSEESPTSPTAWNDLAWEHLENFDSLGCVDLDAAITVGSPMQAPDNQFQWGRNAADMAYILYQVPVMVAFHADDMLE